MSQYLAKLNNARTTPLKDRAKILALAADIDYGDSLTKQCFADECNIDLIMQRYNKTGTISHVSKYEGVYADYSDFNFHEQTTKLARGREIFDDLPAELRQEFNQSPAVFFNYVNNPDNADKLREKLGMLAPAGRQLPSADLEAAEAATSEPVASDSPTPAEPAITPEVPPA